VLIAAASLYTATSARDRGFIMAKLARRKAQTAPRQATAAVPNRHTPAHSPSGDQSMTPK
jgi:hypothetical protein